MKFTLSTVARSLAAHLSGNFPGVTFFEDPNQQGSTVPCMFLQQRYSNLKLQTAGRWLRTIGLDLTYLEDYNRPDMQQLYQEAAETLDLVMETFPYTDGADTGALRTYEREWRIDLDALHYKFEIRVIVHLPEPYTPMRTMDYKEDVTDGG